MTFDGNDIQDTYNLRLASVTGLEDREKFKSVLPYWNGSDALSIKEEKTVTAHLFGSFNTTGELATAISELNSAIDVGPRHTVVFDDLGYTLSCVAKEGFKTRIYGADRCTIEIDLPLTIYTTG
jgi:hypothetical protein